MFVRRRVKEEESLPIEKCVQIPKDSEGLAIKKSFNGGRRTLAIASGKKGKTHEKFHDIGQKVVIFGQFRP